MILVGWTQVHNNNKQETEMCHLVNSLNILSEKRTTVRWPMVISHTSRMQIGMCIVPA